MDDNDYRGPIDALPILGARLESTPHPGRAFLWIETREGAKLFLCQRHQLEEIARAMTEFAAGMQYPGGRPS